MEECSICRETPGRGEAATVSGCGHTFCTTCIVSWAGVRAECALCRTPFRTLLVCRTLDGAMLDEACEEPVALLRRAAWLHVVPVSPSSVDAFAPPPADMAVTVVAPNNTAATGAAVRTVRTAAPYYADENVEDELEALFWEDEEKRYRDHNRMVGNRPFGANGYLASGRRLARTAPLSQRPSRRERAAAAAAANGSACNYGKRKKKVKKKSRAGRAAAAAASSTSAAAIDM